MVEGGAGLQSQSWGHQTVVLFLENGMELKKIVPKRACITSILQPLTLRTAFTHAPCAVTRDNNSKTKMSRSHDGMPGLHDLSFWHVARDDPFRTYPTLHLNVTLRPGRCVPPAPNTCPLASDG